MIQRQLLHINTATAPANQMIQEGKSTVTVIQSRHATYDKKSESLFGTEHKQPTGCVITDHKQSH